MNITHTYTLPLALALEGLALTAPYMASKKDGETTPVLYGVQVTAGSLKATDRYGVARYRDDRIEGHTDVNLIPADAVAWIQGIKRLTLRNHAGKRFSSPRADLGKDPYSIRIDIAESEKGTDHEVVVSLLTEESVERSQAFDYVGGNIPPVDRLYPEHPLTRNDERVGIDHLSAWQLERLGKTLKTLDADTVALLTTRDNFYQSGKLSPVHVTLPPTDAPVDYLIQPNLVKP